uniref:Uncharacterized protein n=1 Tax=Scleropages formosus TaxID=113540 RepID=A0A8C9QW84_SCLFO
VHGHQQGWGGHHDQLQGPEAHLRDGEEVVKADVLAAWLPGVAHKVLLLILPHVLCGRHKHQYAEGEDDGEPNPSYDRGVLVHPSQDVPQEVPVHCYSHSSQALQ